MVFPFTVPKDEDSLIEWGQGQQTHLDSEFDLLVWNVFKGRHGEKWQKDFLQLSADKQMILLQEAMHDSVMPKLLQEKFDKHHWKMATSFTYRNQDKTGVLTGSQIHAEDLKILRSEDREFLILTPKVSLVSLYPVPESNETVLVINTHAVNFTTQGAYERFITEIVLIIGKHQGPVLFAGDFNTWNSTRWSFLQKTLAALGLLPVSFAQDPRFLKLDHIFLRGIDASLAKIHSEVQSSDHFPLSLRLKIEK